MYFTKSTSHSTVKILPIWNRETQQIQTVLWIPLEQALGDSGKYLKTAPSQRKTKKQTKKKNLWLNQA